MADPTLLRLSDKTSEDTSRRSLFFSVLLGELLEEHSARAINLLCDACTIGVGGAHLPENEDAPHIADRLVSAAKFVCGTLTLFEDLRSALIQRRP